LFLLFVVLGFELRDTGVHSLSHASGPFWSGYIGDKVWDDSHVPPHPVIFHQDGLSQMFFAQAGLKP
jgi:hypothetical protein